MQWAIPHLQERVKYWKSMIITGSIKCSCCKKLHCFGFQDVEMKLQLT